MVNISAAFTEGLRHGVHVGLTGDMTRLKQMKDALQADSEEKETSE